MEHVAKVRLSNDSLSLQTLMNALWTKITVTKMPTASTQRVGSGVSAMKATLEMESPVKVRDCKIHQQNLLLLFLFIALCSRSLQLDFGRVNITGLTAVYSCYEGYVMFGDKSRRCLNDGTWTGSAPTCRPICKLCSFTYEVVVTQFYYTTAAYAPYNLRILKLPSDLFRVVWQLPCYLPTAGYNVSYTFGHSSSLSSLLQEFSSNRQTVFLPPSSDCYDFNVDGSANIHMAVVTAVSEDISAPSDITYHHIGKMLTNSSTNGS